MDRKDIKAIIDLMKKNSISEFELERQEFKIKLKRSNGGPTVMEEGTAPPVYLAHPGTVASTAPQALPPATATAPAGNEMDIKSPMVGTFYRAPSPEAVNYVEVGTEVNPDTVVCII